LAGAPARGGDVAMAFDERQGVMLMLGAGFPGDALWDFDGNRWRRVLPVAPAPVLRDWPAMTFDPARGEIVLTCETFRDGNLQTERRCGTWVY